MRLITKILCTTLGGQILIANLGYSLKESMIYAFFIAIIASLLSEISDKLSYIIKKLIK